MPLSRAGISRTCTSSSSPTAAGWGFPSDDYAPDLVWEDHAALKVARELSPGQEFSYTFDFGDDWRHRCRVLDEKADPAEAYGATPRGPVAIWGWGWIPDQYGRETLED